MARSKARRKPIAPSRPAPAAANGPVEEVLTLTEAAAYLRLPEPEVVQLVYSQDLPGRLAGKKWRFLKSALQDWLSKSPSKGSKEAQLSVAGILKDAPDLIPIVEEIYR
jgi:excisionase family DNA binding protein